MINKLRCLAAIVGLTLFHCWIARADITNNLALYLPLDETSGLTAFDSSSNANNGTAINYTLPAMPWTTNGRINGAVQMNFPGTTTQYISVPQSSTLDFGTANAFTISAWVMCTNPAGLLSGSAVMCKGTGGGNEQYDMDISAAGTGGFFRIVTRNSGGTATTVIATVKPTATFTHVAGVYDGTGHTLKIYINGQLNNTTSSANLASVKTSSHEVSIGNRQSTSTSVYNLPFVAGVIDDVHIYGRALSASDVFQLYASNGKAPIISAQPHNYSCYAGDVAAFSVTVDAVNSIVPVSYQWQLNGTNLPGGTAATLGITNVTTAMNGLPVTVIITNVVGATTSAPVTLGVSVLPAANITAGLVAYYPFDDSPGSTTAADATTNATPATLSGFTDFVGCWTNGLIAGGLNFGADGTALDAVFIPGQGQQPPPVLDFSTNGVFTIAAWVNGLVLQTNGAALFAKGTGNGGEQFCVDLSGGHYRFFTRNSAAAVVTATALTSIAPNHTWQHIVCVCDTSNGPLECYINGQLAAEGISSSNLLSNTHEISIGNRQSSTAGYNEPWSGVIDDVHFYSRAFTSADVQALYLQGGVFPPSFVTQPVGASLYVGDNFRMTAAVSGTLPLNLQWFQGATALAGATNPTLVFQPLVASNAGSYTLVASNAYGVSNSTPAVLTLTPFTPTNALAGYWTFDDGTNATAAADSSGNGNNGNLTDFPDFISEWIVGRTNGAINFNPAGGPVNEYVDIPDSPSLNFNTNLNFSIAAWVRGQPTQANGACIVAKGVGSVNEEYAMDVETGTYRFYVRNAAGTATTLLTTVTPNSDWQHVVATYDGGFTTMTYYVNGVAVATNTAAPPTLLVDNAHDVTVGCREASISSGYSLPFVGAIDDVRIYDRTLNSNDVQAVYQSVGILSPLFYTQPLSNATLFAGANLTLSALADGSSPLNFQWQLNSTNVSGATNSSLALTNIQVAQSGIYNLVVSNQGGTATSSNSVITVTAFSITNTAAYYKFDETTGLTANDSSTNANTGTLFGFIGDDSQWGPGRIGGGLTFNTDASGGDVMTAPDSASLNFSNTVAFSLVAWVRGTPTQVNGAGVIAKGFGAGGEQYALDVHADQLPTQAYRFYVRNAAGTSFPLTTAVTPTGRWQHLAATFDGNGGLMSIYVNGQLIVSQSAPPSLLSSTHELSVGNRQVNSGSGYDLPFTGEMDDVRIYSRALQASEIQSIYALAVPFAPVVYTQPQSSTNYTGTSVTFGPSTDGTDPLSYQWFKNSNSIPHATNASLTLSNLQSTDAGNYSLQVTNTLGQTNTQSAALTVLPLKFSGGTIQSDGTFLLNFNGPPNGSFHVYSSPDITLPFSQWILLNVGNFDPTGAASVTDFNPATNNAAQFYRFSFP